MLWLRFCCLFLCPFSYSLKWRKLTLELFQDPDGVWLRRLITIMSILHLLWNLISIRGRVLSCQGLWRKLWQRNSRSILPVPDLSCVCFSMTASCKGVMLLFWSTPPTWTRPRRTRLSTLVLGTFSWSTTSRSNWRKSAQVSSLARTCWLWLLSTPSRRYWILPMIRAAWTPLSHVWSLLFLAAVDNIN